MTTIDPMRDRDPIAYSLGQAARVIGCSPAWARKLVEAGELEERHDIDAGPGRRFVTGDSVRRFKREREAQ